MRVEDGRRGHEAGRQAQYKSPRRVRARRTGVGGAECGGAAEAVEAGARRGR